MTRSSQNRIRRNTKPEVNRVSVGEGNPKSIKDRMVNVEKLAGVCGQNILDMGAQLVRIGESIDGLTVGQKSIDKEIGRILSDIEKLEKAQNVLEDMLRYEYPGLQKLEEHKTEISEIWEALFAIQANRITKLGDALAGSQAKDRKRSRYIELALALAGLALALSGIL